MAQSSKCTGRVLVATSLALALLAAGCGSDQAGDGAASGSSSATTVAASPHQIEPVAAEAGPAGDTGSGDDNVVGGGPLEITDAPWTAAIGLSDGRQICGGVLVSESQVWTAAHCVTESGTTTIVDPASLRVVLGRTDLRESTGEIHEVAQVLVSTQWDPDVNEHDYAALVLSEPSRQQAVAVPTTDSVTLWDADSPAQVQGWGCTTGRSGGCNASPTLREGDLVMQSPDVCSGPQPGLAQGNPSFDATSQLCGIAAGEGGISCFGDSGGPLTAVGSDGNTYLIGLVSFGFGDCPADAFDYYAFAPAMPDDEYDSRP